MVKIPHRSKANDPYVPEYFTSVLSFSSIPEILEAARHNIKIDVTCPACGMGQQGRMQMIFRKGLWTRSEKPDQNRTLSSG